MSEVPQAMKVLQESEVHFHQKLMQSFFFWEGVNKLMHLQFLAPVEFFLSS